MHIAINIKCFVIFINRKQYSFGDFLNNENVAIVIIFEQWEVDLYYLYFIDVKYWYSNLINVDWILGLLSIYGCNTKISEISLFLSGKFHSNQKEFRKSSDINILCSLCLADQNKIVAALKLI